MQRLARRNNNCDVTVAMLVNGLQLRPVQTVPACPVQIRAHHYIDVYTDNLKKCDSCRKEEKVGKLLLWVCTSCIVMIRGRKVTVFYETRFGLV